MFIICVRDPDFSNEFQVFAEGQPDPRIIDIDLGRDDLRNRDEFIEWAEGLHEEAERCFKLGTPNARDAGEFIEQTVRDAADNFGHEAPVPAYRLREIRERKEQDYERGTNDTETFDGIPERTVLGRVMNGRDMAALATTGSSYMAYEDYEIGLVDALTNLMHYARRYEIDFEAALGTANMHHDAEKRYGWDEVPDA